MRRKLAVDIDNTIWDLVSPWIGFYNIYYNDNVNYSDIVEYNFFNITKKATKEELLNILSSDSFWAFVYPYKESKEYLEKLNDEFELYIVTSTSYKTSMKKFERFFELFDFLNEDQLIITSNKCLLNVDIIVDDFINNLSGDNHIKFLIDQPYNKDINDDTIIRVKNLKEVYFYLHKDNIRRKKQAMITIYTTETCPKCKILKKKLDSKNIDYNEVNDIDVLKSLDIYEVPILDVNGEYLEFNEANSWVNNQ